LQDRPIFGERKYNMFEQDAGRLVSVGVVGMEPCSL
jgi:hypothetical protein